MIGGLRKGETAGGGGQTRKSSATVPCVREPDAGEPDDDSGIGNGSGRSRSVKPRARSCNICQDKNAIMKAIRSCAGYF